MEINLCGLKKRKVQLAARCSNCKLNINDRDHIFVTCSFAQGFWVWIGDVLRWDMQQFSHVLSVWELFQWMHQHYCNSRILKSLFAAAIWHLWRARNARLHDNIAMSSEVIARHTLIECLEVQNASLNDLVSV
ncbi:uncharacterized protein LOC132270588 [Cornus florida]|uniref:uncharacterized protein LOC132270588 n=1 Tax=Cornus florida TaxID=4283 RepID=UPI002899749B|nr:uncharacterized protein LOC132270588 [Cornus florida]